MINPPFTTSPLRGSTYHRSPAPHVNMGFTTTPHPPGAPPIIHSQHTPINHTRKTPRDTSPRKHPGTPEIHHPKASRIPRRSDTKPLTHHDPRRSAPEGARSCLTPRLRGGYDKANKKGSGEPVVVFPTTPTPRHITRKHPRIPRRSTTKAPPPRPATKRPEGAGSYITPRLRGGYDQSQQKKARRAVVGIPRHQPRDTSPESIPAYHDAAPRRHPTTTCDEAPGGRGITLTPRLRGGLRQNQQKGSESRCCNSATP